MRYILLFSSVLVLLACSPQTTNDQQEDSNAGLVIIDSTSGPLYPFVQYIRDQIAYVDSTPFAVEMITEIDGQRADSTLISKESFKQFTGTFTDTDPNFTGLRPLYQETSFEDLTLGTLTFTIKALDPSLPLQQADILLNPETKRVKHVYLVKFGSKDDSIKQQNLLWVHNYRCQISSIVEPPDAKQYTKTIKLIWDKPLE